METYSDVPLGGDELGGEVRLEPQPGTPGAADLGF
jgi:hypothetical protein